MTVALLGHNLMIASRVAAAAERAGVPFTRVDDPATLPPAGQLALLLVDWDDRSADWGRQIAAWCAAAPESARPRVVLFGPHVDLEAHAAARSAGLSPMMARSKLISDLPALLALTTGRHG